MAGYYSVCSCNSVDCPGGCGPEEPIDDELYSLSQTPEGLGLEKAEEVEVPFSVRLVKAIAQIHEDDRARVERRRVA